MRYSLMLHAACHAMVDCTLRLYAKIVFSFIQLFLVSYFAKTIKKQLIQ